jgi:hypothetical protein
MGSEDFMTEAITTRGLYEWKQNASGKWAWFEDGRQKTGAYPSHSDADCAFTAHRLKAGSSHNTVSEQRVEDHPQFERLQRVYGSLTSEQAADVVSQMDADIKSHQRVGVREFNGNGGRRTGAAVSAEAARNIAEEKLLLRLYMRNKFGDKAIADLHP